jgi:hypothetical protein
VKEPNLSFRFLLQFAKTSKDTYEMLKYMFGMKIHALENISGVRPFNHRRNYDATILYRQ